MCFGLRSQHRASAAEIKRLHIVQARVIVDIENKLARHSQSNLEAARAGEEKWRTNKLGRSAAHKQSRQPTAGAAAAKKEARLGCDNTPTAVKKRCSGLNALTLTTDVDPEKSSTRLRKTRGPAGQNTATVSKIVKQYKVRCGGSYTPQKCGRLSNDNLPYTKDTCKSDSHHAQANTPAKHTAQHVHRACYKFAKAKAGDQKQEVTRS